jgi:hypothetical protein
MSLPEAFTTGIHKRREGQERVHKTDDTLMSMGPSGLEVHLS